MFKLTYKIEKEPVHLLEDNNIVNSKSAADAFRRIYANDNADLEDCERCYAMYMNGNNDIIGYALISIGGQSSTTLDINKVLRMAIMCNARGMLLCHNHPSGNCKPGQSDIKETERLKDIAYRIDICLLDHIILTENGYFSFNDN